MDTKKYEALLVSSELGSFTRAAQELGYTQSGLTHMMNALEQEVGFPLLERGHYGTRLTVSGQRLEPLIRRFLDAAQDLEREQEAIRHQESQQIRVAAYSSMALHWLPAIMQQFREAFPDVRVDVQMGGVEEIYSWVRGGEVDMGFVSRQDDLKAEFYPIKRDPLVAILPIAECEGRTTFPVEEFDGREFLLPALGFTRDIMPVFRKNQIHPRIRKTTVDDPVVISMVAHGLGVSIMTELIMQNQQSGIVGVLPIAPAAWRELGVIVRSRSELKPGVQALIDCAKRTVAAMGDNS